MQTKAIRLNPVVRSVGVISAVAILVGGVTFAALQGRATLTDNTISSASAGLLVDGNADGTFSEEEPGYAFEGIIPGVTPSEAKTFSLQNAGDTDLKIKAKIRHTAVNAEGPEMRSQNGDENGGEPNDPTLPELPAGVDATDIVFTFTPTDGGEAVTATWKQLTSWKGATILDRLSTGDANTAEFTVQVSIDESVNVSAIDIGSFDIVFKGKAVAAAEVPEEPEAPEESDEETTAPEEEAPAEEPAPVQ